MGKPIQVTFKNTNKEQELSDYIHGKTGKALWIKDAAYLLMQLEKNNLVLPQATEQQTEKHTEEQTTNFPINKNELAGLFNKIK